VARELPRFLAPPSAAAPVRLEVRNLSKRFDGVAALDDISITLNFDRSIIGLIGPNGAGKTTLFNCISGAVQPTSGSIIFPGLPAKHLPHHAAMARIGRTFQNPNLFHSMSVRENVAMGSISARPPLADDQIEELLGHCGLSDVADCEVAALPLGTQRRIELARALALQPRLLLLDEIAAGLGIGEKQSLADTIRRLAKDGQLNFLVVEHDMDFILSLAEDIVVLNAGRLLARGKPENVSSDPAVIDAYLGGHYVAA
jgi:ABC-type branched-subunit amino acid transport system ATPase component